MKICLQCPYIQFANILSYIPINDHTNHTRDSLNCFVFLRQLKDYLGLGVRSRSKTPKDKALSLDFVLYFSFSGGEFYHHGWRQCRGPLTVCPRGLCSPAWSVAWPWRSAAGLGTTCSHSCTKPIVRLPDIRPKRISGGHPEYQLCWPGVP